MPVLELFEDDEQTSWVKLRSAMYFPSPKEEGDRLRFEAVLRVRQLASLKSDSEGFRDLAIQASEEGCFGRIDDWEENTRVVRAASFSETSGRTAAAVLQFLLSLAYNPKYKGQATVRRAIDGVQRAFAGGTQMSQGRPVPASLSSIKRAWRHHSPVAHFWAAHRLAQELTGKQPTSLWGLAALAESIQVTAQDLAPDLWPGGAEAWSIPSELGLEYPPFVPLALNRPALRRVIAAYEKQD